MTKPLHFALSLLCVSILAAPAARPQTATPLPARLFDVATIKPSPAAGTGPVDWMGIRNDPDGIAAQFVTLSMLIQHAYGLRSKDQVSGGPAWVMDERFDIQAKMSDADTAAMQKLAPGEANILRRQMVQSLLAERFKLKVHTAIRQSPAYDLVVAKGGPKLKDAATDTDPTLARGEDGKPRFGFNQATGNTMAAQGYSTQALADFLSQPVSGLGRPVVDKTGLTSTYDFTLNWVPHWEQILPGSASSAPSPEDANSLFEALGQLGLKLQPATSPIDTLIIDHVEQPSEN